MSGDELARVSEGKVSDKVSKVILWEVEKERVDATLPQFRNEGPAQLVRKSPLKRHRGRSGWDFVSYSFKIDHYHPAIIRLPEVYRASIHPAILVASSLRGPPVA